MIGQPGLFRLPRKCFTLWQEQEFSLRLNFCGSCIGFLMDIILLTGGNFVVRILSYRRIQRFCRLV